MGLASRVLPVGIKKVPMGWTQTELVFLFMLKANLHTFSYKLHAVQEYCRTGE
jgi:hypothetical protein